MRITHLANQPLYLEPVTYDRPLPSGVVQMMFVVLDGNVWYPRSCMLSAQQSEEQINVFGSFLQRHDIPYILPCARIDQSKATEAKVVSVRQACDSAVPNS